MQEPIYSAKEQEARYLLREFITNIGKVTVPDKANTNGITAEDLLTAFNRIHPDNAAYLNPAAVNQFILSGGYVKCDEVQTKIYLHIDLHNFETLNRNLQLAVIEWIQENRTLNYRKILLGYSTAGSIPYLLLIKHFISQYCILSNNFYAQEYLNSTNYRASTKDLYNYFKDVCITCAVEDIPTKSAFFDVLQKELKYKIKQCYVKGKSGTRSFYKILIPITNEDRNISLQYGMAIITNKDGKQVTSNGLTSIYTQIELNHLHETRIERLTGGTIEEKEELRRSEVESTTNRTEDGKNALSEIKQQEDFIEEQAAISRTEEDHLPDIIGNDQRLPEAEATIYPDERTSSGIENPIAATDFPTDETSDIEYEDESYDEDAEYEDESYDEAPVTEPEAIDKDDERRRKLAEGKIKAEMPGGEDIADPMAGKEYLLNGAPEDYDEETGLPLTPEQKKAKLPLMRFENILYVCKTVPSYSDPAKLTLEDLTQLMSTMHTELKPEEIYPELIKALSK